MLVHALSGSRRWLAFALCQLALLIVFTSPALAAGRVVWKNKAVKEREDKSWRLDVEIYLPKAPDTAHVPMKFEFEPTAYYARDLLDGDKIVERVEPLVNRQSLIEGVEVGFLDSGSGKIEPRTRFSFKVTRAHGYEAGEYKVTIRDTRTGNTVGTPTTLKFEGQNETVDRRAMVFASKDDKKKEKKDEPAAAESTADTAAEDDPAPQSEDPAPGSEDETAADRAAAEGPPPIEQKPGGCGCRVAGASGPWEPLLSLLLLMGLAARRARAR
jgi:MYXO-CTERM domain-containing protein